MSKSWMWISGWAIHPDHFKSSVESTFPEDSHQVLAPKQDTIERVLAGSFDYIGGYSLGSLLLLSALERIPEDTKVFCLSPFIAFCKEDQLGGSTPKATLQTLRQQLQKQPARAVKLFYRLTGLRDPAGDSLPYPAEHLEWGLEQLAILRANTNSLSRVKAIAGLQDPLINIKEMKSHWPTCHFADDCSHDYQKLLTALSSTVSIEDPFLL